MSCSGPLFGESGEVVLHLTDTGELTEIPVPIGRQRRRAVRRDSGQPAGGPEGAREKASGGPTRLGPEDGRGLRSGRTRPCPLCGAEVSEQEKSYGCSGWQVVQVRDLEDDRRQANHGATAQAPLSQGRSPVLKGFKSKSGKPFEARLKLDQGEVRFDFGS